MQTYIIIVEDRDMASNKLFSVKANSSKEAEKIFIQKYTPYIDNLEWDDLDELLQRIDVYINIIDTREIIDLSK